MADKRIHFGWFVRMLRDDKRYSQAKLGRLIGEVPEGKSITSKRVSDIETTMAEPNVHGTTLEGLSKALGFADVPAFIAAWKVTPVEKPTTKRGRPARRLKMPLELEEKIRAAAAFAKKDPVEWLEDLVTITESGEPGSAAPPAPSSKARKRRGKAGQPRG